MTTHIIFIDVPSRGDFRPWRFLTDQEVLDRIQLLEKELDFYKNYRKNVENMGIKA